MDVTNRGTRRKHCTGAVSSLVNRAWRLLEPNVCLLFSFEIQPLNWLVVVVTDSDVRLLLTDFCCCLLNMDSDINLLLALLSQRVSLFFFCRNRTVHRLLMMNNQRATSSSTFQLQQTAQPSVESQLFNDIIKEKSQILSDLMDQFLQVQPFSKFESEFNLFARRIKHITSDKQRNGTYRHTVQTPSENDTPTEDDASRENNRKHIKSFNIFQRYNPMTTIHKLKTTLTHNDQLKNIPCTSNNS
ncbi:Uncharacterized protein FWK35_00035001, partial [Aphis craccivora]